MGSGPAHLEGDHQGEQAQGQEGPQKEGRVSLNRKGFPIYAVTPFLQFPDDVLPGSFRSPATGASREAKAPGVLVGLGCRKMDQHVR